MLERSSQAREHRRRSVNAAEDRVAERDRERSVAGEALGAEHGVPEAERPGLARVGEAEAEMLEGEAAQQLLVSAPLEHAGEQRVTVEVILDRALAATGDEDDPLDRRRRQLLDDVLDDGLAGDGQHLLGL